MTEETVRPDGGSRACRRVRVEGCERNKQLVGIVGYGAYIPKNRIKTEAIAQAWAQDYAKITASLAVHEKAVASYDQDTVTLAVQAAENALVRADIAPEIVGALYIGSESHPYAVKPSATIIGTALGCSRDYLAVDMEFACKGGTAALQAAYGLIASNLVQYALAIGSDVAQAAPGDILEYTAAAGAAGFIMSANNQEFLATIDATLSVSSDTPDFWRRSLQQYPEHVGRFTGEPSYFAHTCEAAEKIMAKTGSTQQDFDHVIFHQPNGKFPMQAGKKLGFSHKQLELGLISPDIGNSYSATALLGLTCVLDRAEAGQKILLVSYGSGSGSDAFVMTTTSLLQKRQHSAKKTSEYIHDKKYIGYAQYRQIYQAREGIR